MTDKIKSVNVVDELVKIISSDDFKRNYIKLLNEEKKVIWKKFLRFSAVEALRLGKEFKRALRNDGNVVCVNKIHERGEMLYVIYYKKNGYDIEVKNKLLEIAKNEFIEKTKKTV